MNKDLEIHLSIFKRCFATVLVFHYFNSTNLPFFPSFLASLIPSLHHCIQLIYYKVCFEILPYSRNKAGLCGWRDECKMILALMNSQSSKSRRDVSISYILWWASGWDAQLSHRAAGHWSPFKTQMCIYVNIHMCICVNIHMKREIQRYLLSAGSLLKWLQLLELG